MDSLALTLTIINAGQAILDDAQAQIDALPTEKVVNITVTTDAPAVAAETATATTAADEDIEATIKALMDGNAEFETQFQLTMVAAQQAIGKTDLALASMGGSETEAGSGLTALGVGEDGIAAGADSIMGSMGAMMSTLAPIAALFGIGLGVKETLNIMEQQTEATAALNNAFKDVKTSIPTAELDALSNKMSSMGFDNVEVTQSLTDFTLATKSGSKAVTDESAAADLAAYSHISLTAATNQLIKGSQGQARALKTLALEGLIPVVNNEKAMAAAHAAVTTAQNAVTTSTNSLSNAQIAYNKAVQEYGPNSSEAETADNSLQNAQISHQDAVDKLSTANTNLANKQRDLANPTWQMSQLTDELKGKIGGLANAQSQTLGGAFDIVKAKVENFVGSAGQDAENWFVKNQGTIMKVAGILLGPLFTAFTAIGGAIGDVVNTLTKFYDKNKTIIDDILNVLVTIIGTVLVVAFKILSTETQIVADLWVTAFNLVMDAIQLVINIVESIVGVVERVVGSVQSFFGGLVQNIENLGTNIWNAVTSPFETAWTWLSTNVFNPIGDFFSGLGSAISSTIGGVTGAIESPFKTAFDWIAHAWNDSIGAVSFTIPSWVPLIGNDKFSMPKMPILDTGAMVTGSGLAYLHASEVIVNPQQQAEAMSGLMGGGSGAGGNGNVQLIFTGNYLLSNNAMMQFAQQVEQIVVTKLLPAGGRMVTL